MSKWNIKNKLCSLVLILLGYLITLVDNDCTAFVIILAIAVPMFFSKESWFYED